MRCPLLLAVALTAPLTTPLHGQAASLDRFGLERNLIYGMYSGLALLMDVHRPEKPNGRGVLFVTGTAWYAPTGYGAPSYKDSARSTEFAVTPLVEAGYTVFVLNHRATPRFSYPAPLEDVQRAARFIRHHAERFGIRPAPLAGVGISSGAHLMSLLGVLDGTGSAEERDPVAQQSAKLQCVVAFAPPTDLTAIQSSLPWFFSSLMGGLVLLPNAPKESAEYRAYQAASPISHVSADDAAFLLIHGDPDEIVPVEQSERFEAALRGAGARAELIRMPGVGHFLGSVAKSEDVMPHVRPWLNGCMGIP